MEKLSDLNLKFSVKTTVFQWLINNLSYSLTSKVTFKSEENDESVHSILLEVDTFRYT